MDNTPIEDIVGLNHLILILRRDLDALSNEQLRFLLHDTKDRIKTTENRIVGENKQVLKNMVQIAITHYDENWPLTGDHRIPAIEQNIQLIEMTNALGVGIDMNLDLKYSVLIDVLLYRLSCADQLDSDATAAILGKIDTLIHILDDFAIEELKRNQCKLTSPCELVAKLSRDTSKLKQCLQLVADPRHVLRHYVRELVKALDDHDCTALNKSFNRMKEKIFENPYAGVDYQVLNKYKETLYKISEFESLLVLLKELNTQSESFKLSQLCPALTQADFICGSETEDCLNRLLMLPRGIRVHRFEEQRRPAVLSARLSDGSQRRLLVKTGEELVVDAAALRVIRSMGITSQDYQVTTLGDDSGLIQYLEDHKRDTREHSISQYQKMCAKIPAHAFRSIMELNSFSFQDFINKKLNYEESLAAMTYATSLLGLKDRHLENILYDVVSGCLRSVDWNSSLQHSQSEPPPARLTRCLLAPCRKQVLESRLQQLTSETRSSHRLLLATLQISFKWMEDEIQDKVTNLLRHCTDPQILAITRSAWEPWI
ncbi:Serine/threonine-protein kinase TOR [Papilio machaon]|uniref:Serine/threonine-protein kinase TOR n=1 Tax=Papilio machaon TaxID=76193 RepID=A0A0N0PB19_PAPMA|nr:Serine/threonine-protein kinase TOR [Papilio machaon]